MAYRAEMNVEELLMVLSQCWDVFVSFPLQLENEKLSEALTPVQDVYNSAYRIEDFERMIAHV